MVEGKAKKNTTSTGRNSAKVRQDHLRVSKKKRHINTHFLTPYFSKFSLLNCPSHTNKVPK